LLTEHQSLTFSNYLEDDKKNLFFMKKFIPYLLFSVTTLHTILGTSPVMAMGCNSHSDKAETICDGKDKECKKNISANTID
tara:strand:- start:55 stop:297 length:243 start_codon:yes stop_codon:yes gene_type:complete